MALSSFRKWRMFVYAVFFTLSVFGQQNDSLPSPDSLSTILVERLPRLSSDEAIKSIEKYRKGKISIRQLQLLDAIRNLGQETKSFLKQGIDTGEIASVLNETKILLPVVNDGVFVDQGSVQTQRNLSVTSVILRELFSRVNYRKQTLAHFTNRLILLKYHLDSLYADSALYEVSADSAEMKKYVGKLFVLQREFGQVDTALTNYLIGAQDLQTRLDMLTAELGFIREDLEKFRTGLSDKVFNREVDNIWGSPMVSRPFREIIDFSIKKQKLAFQFYLSDNQGKFFILFVLVFLSFYFIRSLRQKITTSDELENNHRDYVLIRHPILSAIIIVFSLSQFIFVDPPFIINFCFWLISALSLTFIMRNFIPPFWMGFWLAIIGLFVLACLDNMILQASNLEQWILIGLSFSGALIGGFIFFSDQRPKLRENSILFFVLFMVVCETLSIVLNVFGRFNGAKTLMVVGYSGLLIAVSFLWTVRLLNEGLGLASSLYTHPDKKLFYLNFERIGEKVPRIFYLALGLGWFILVARNFYAFRELTEPFNIFLQEQRTWGDYSFSVNGLFVFLLIILIAIFISRIISFFTTDQESQNQTPDKPARPTLGSWILLIRIVVIIMGLFLAFAAAGIPLDRITIILGALGVGVGLGLQGLVNNLVSGLIIAFEKPVNVGDMIEVNGMFCTMKSIGFRSSIVIGLDGSHVVIPNGDLLSQHLINWRMGRNRKRITVSVGVAYGSEVDKVKAILTGVLNNHSDVIKIPAPLVVAKSFSSYAIEFDLHFWVDVRLSLSIKSDVINRVNEVCKAEGIVIPYPQQDLRVVSLPENLNIESEKIRR